MTALDARRVLKAALGVNALVGAALLVALASSLLHPAPRGIDGWDFRLHGAVAGLVAVLPAAAALAGALLDYEKASGRALVSFVILPVLGFAVAGLQVLILFNAGATCGPLRGLVAPEPCMHPLWLLVPALAANVLGVGAVLAAARARRSASS